MVNETPAGLIRCEPSAPAAAASAANCLTSRDGSSSVTLERKSEGPLTPVRSL